MLLTAVLTTQCMRKWWGHGEVWAARLMSAVLNQRGLPAACLMPASFYALNAPHNRRLMKGFLTRCCNSCRCNIRQTSGGDRIISRNNAGETVLLGRNGSDDSATQIGALACFSRNHLERRRRGIQCRPA
ncbi:hypothetical protein ACNKHT_26035 [Shigella flexneri]